MRHYEEMEKRENKIKEIYEELHGIEPYQKIVETIRQNLDRNYENPTKKDFIEAIRKKQIILDHGLKRISKEFLILIFSRLKKELSTN